MAEREDMTGAIPGDIRHTKSTRAGAAPKPKTPGSPGTQAAGQQTLIDSGLAMAGADYNRPASERFNEAIIEPIKLGLTYRPGMAPYGSDPKPSTQQTTAQQVDKASKRFVQPQKGNFTVISDEDKARAYTQADADRFRQQEAERQARKPVTGADGITRGINEQGNRTFSGGIDADLGPANTQDMSDYVKQANAGFERALAAGDYETALRMVNRSDPAQMARLGQLQGNIRTRREQELAASKVAKNSIDPRARDAANRMLSRAEELAQKGSSRGAQRLSSEARALLGMGGGTAAQGRVPVSPLTEGIDTAADIAKQQADAESANLTAQQARVGAQQQQQLQGILEGLNDPNATPEQRESLMRRYRAMQGNNNYIETERVVGFDMDGSPVTAKVKVDPVTGQSIGGADQYMSDMLEGIRLAAQSPEMRDVINARLMQLYGRGLPDQEVK